MIQFRKSHPALRRREFLDNDAVAWHGVRPLHPDWTDESKLVSYTLKGQRTGRETDCDIYVIVNGAETAIIVTAPSAPNGGIWRRVVDTAKDAPADFLANDGPRLAPGAELKVADRSLVVFCSESD
jgi:glycogen operon protein